MSRRDARGRFACQPEPDTGPYEIEVPIINGVADYSACGVVDLRRPNPDPDHKGGQGFYIVFCGTFSECNAWIEEHAP